MKRLESRDELNKGVKEYKSGHIDQAIAHFRKATELDPGMLMAKSYLGYALTQKVIPDVDTPENLKMAQESIDIFQQVLNKNPHDVNSMKQIAGVDYLIKKLDEAKAWQMKILDEDPKDPEAAYTIGVIDWTEAYQNAVRALSPAGLTDDGEGNLNATAELVMPIVAQNRALVEEGLKYLTQAVENRPNYSDAMVYLNLLYRRKADFDRDNKSAIADDLAQAREWMNKAMAIRKANEEKKAESRDPAMP